MSNLVFVGQIDLNYYFNTFINSDTDDGLLTLVVDCAKLAGISLHAKLGATVARGEPIFTVHAESRGELDYALAFAAANPDVIRWESL